MDVDEVEVAALSPLPVPDDESLFEELSDDVDEESLLLVELDFFFVEPRESVL